MRREKVVERLYCLYETATTDTTLRLQFRECLNILRAQSVPLQSYFELFHEFGHYTKATELGGVTTFLVVSPIVFTFTGKNVSYKVDKTVKISATLSYFEDETDLLDKIQLMIKEGMMYSTNARKIRTWRLRVHLLNRVNSITWKRHRKGSDGYLYKHMTTDSKAVAFNDQAKMLTDVFEKTQSVTAVLNALPK